MKHVVLELAAASLLAIAALAEDSGSALRYQRCLDETRDPQERVGDCERIVKDHGTYYGYGYLGLGEAYAAMGNNEQALAAYSALENFRYWTAPKVKRSALYAEMGDYDKALADANDVIDMRGGKAIGLVSRCWVRAIAGKELQAGLTDCDQALAELPGAAGTLEARAVILLRLGRWADAAAGFDATLKANDKRISALYLRGFAEKQNGDAKTGEADMAAALAANSNAIDFYARTGVVPKP